MAEAGGEERLRELLRSGERIDDLQRNGLKIIQTPELFCFGMDAVLLSGFAAAAPGDQVLDLGTGTGIIPLLMSARTQAARLVGLELQEESADMARRSVCLNGLEERITIVQGDICRADRLFASTSFDVVTSNPPYMIAAHGRSSMAAAKAIARHELCCTFADVARAAAGRLRPGGHFYLVHRPFRLAEIMVTLDGVGLTPKRLRMVHPYADREPNMFLMDCVRGGRHRLAVERPLVVYERPGIYTSELREVYGY
ncbi:tRNA1(Val) (adenine(37)-N6)-methyltransferase [Lachnoclostridium sp. Marseille-P6806]|uniref:tRNA1(Val) (adenine(37)-N6)-methyltransferase n=1 Tax=Lachnoclostridium sp. Marseille-P6806 TaxID=2364793 RepID=UPI001030E644|nr:tRNA1(Val) (adenine(37)-N6)-methyltransferase [Lachnoclostridium sp. Marseille-P6806]